LSSGVPVGGNGVSTIDATVQSLMFRLNFKIGG
jgi:hypothetical protein